MLGVVWDQVLNSPSQQLPRASRCIRTKYMNSWQEKQIFRHKSQGTRYIHQNYQELKSYCDVGKDDVYYLVWVAHSPIVDIDVQMMFCLSKVDICLLICHCDKIKDYFVWHGLSWGIKKILNAFHASHTCLGECSGGVQSSALFMVEGRGHDCSFLPYSWSWWQPPGAARMFADCLFELQLACLQIPLQK